jgi:hypothetical protein
VRHHVQQAAIDIISAIENTSKQAGLKHRATPAARRPTRKRTNSRLTEPTS